MPSYSIVVVPHSHWDREWYVPFEELRFKLVQFMDRLIEQLEHDAEMRTFLLDGQVILLEDYLQIRPEREERLRSLIQAERLIIGPWYSQPDEFLVSAEALVRNLLVGSRYGARFGPVMRQGYIPDTFGHIAQLPQLLRGFGIASFFFMRGLGEDLRETRSEFWWEGPDGSRVLAHYLAETYSNAAILRADPARMALHHGRNTHYDSYDELRAKLARVASGATLLFMNGGDHLLAQPDFAAALVGLRTAVGDSVRNGSLADFTNEVLATRPHLQVVKGEMRFGRYHPILKDVISTRLYLKQANAAAQTLLEGMAERVTAILRTLGDDRFIAFLRYAWTVLLRNHPHDSICGCSVDAVHQEMLTRFARVMEVGQSIVDDALAALSERVAPAMPANSIPVVVFNPSPWARSGLTRVAVAPYTRLRLGERLYDWEPYATEIDVSAYVLRDARGGMIPMRVVGEELHSADMLRRRKNMRRLLIEFEAKDIPALGFGVFQLEPGTPPVVTEVDHHRAANTIENAQLRVTAAHDGTLTVIDKATGATYPGVLAFVDEGDAGDEYTFAPLSAVERCDSRESPWEISVDQDAGVIVLRGSMALPAELAADRQTRGAARVACAITTTVRLTADARRVDIHVEMLNQARDHRLRVAFPTGFAATRAAVAETAFGVISRPTVPEPSEGWRERTSPTYAQQRFVCVERDGQGLAVFNAGLPEYEVSPDGNIWLTLVRAVGWLSRDDLPTRPGPAGPSYATPDAQCLGPHTFEFALMPYAGTWETASVFREAEAFRLPLVARAVQGIRSDPVEAVPFTSLLAIEPADIVLSALKPAEDFPGLIIRIFNPGTESRVARLTVGVALRDVWLTNLNEEVLSDTASDLGRIERTDSSFHVALAPAQVLTIAARFASTPP